MNETLIHALQNPSLYPHPVEKFEVIQTHLSWVILTGPYAYKIKKPLNLGFQDFSTLEKREYYCDLEVLLNKRLAPQIYIGVLPITGSENFPALGGKGDVIEYAIKMYQFPQAGLLRNVAKELKLSHAMMADIARQTARFHQSAEVSDKNKHFGTPQEVFSPIQDNFSALKKLPCATEYLSVITQIEQWAHKQYNLLKELLAHRKENGFIRACHGDLHLGNIVLVDNKPVIFDCIEFNESFRFTDVINDISFLAMDLDHYHLPDFSNYFVNQYLEHTKDYEGLPLLKFYQCYRAMVRAKVTGFQIEQCPKNDPKMISLQSDLRDLLLLASTYTKDLSPSLTITYGLSGSGKSIYTEQLIRNENTIRLRSDVVREKAVYTPQSIEATYFRLRTIAHMLLQEGFHVVIDATCLGKWQRQLFFELSQNLNLPFQILTFDVPIEILKKRIAHRKNLQKDVSDADENVLELQRSAIEPLSDEEKKFATPISIDIIDNLIKLKGNSHA